MNKNNSGRTIYSFSLSRTTHNFCLGQTDCRASLKVCGANFTMGRIMSDVRPLFQVLLHKDDRMDEKITKLTFLVHVNNLKMIRLRTLSF